MWRRKKNHPQGNQLLKCEEKVFSYFSLLHPRSLFSKRWELSALCQINHIKVCGGSKQELVWKKNPEKKSFAVEGGLRPLFGRQNLVNLEHA